MTDVNAVRSTRLLGPVGLLLFFLALPVLLLTPPALAGTGVDGSYHDFSGEAIDDGYGICAPCHQPHYSPDGRLIWSRSLGEEELYFDQTPAQLIPSNYVPGMTLACYDCHDDNQNTPPLVDDQPTRPDPPGPWGTEFPQNIAFEDNAAQGDDPSETGYYELQGGFVPNEGGPDVPDPSGAPPVTQPTGGHYWKGVLETSGSPDGPIEYGDKMACVICHDPHDTAATANNAVFLRRIIPAGGDPDIDIGSALRASSASRNPGAGGDGREMCEACHYNSDYSGTLREMFGVTVPKPPPITFDGHSPSDPTTPECTKCHPHNAPDCGACHGSPPRLEGSGYVSEAANYDNGNFDEATGPHGRHANDLDDPDQPGYEFDCGFCHDTFPAQHRDTNFDDAVFRASKNPSGSYTRPTCSLLYCHSRGVWINDQDDRQDNPVSVDWTDSPDPTWAVNINCENCHGTDAATKRSPGDVEFGAPGYTDSSIETFPGVFKANKHTAHKYPCRVCHFTVTRDADPAGGWTLYDPPGVPPDLPVTHVSNDTTAFGYDVVSETGVPDGDDGLWFSGYSYLPDGPTQGGGQCFNVDCHGGQDPYWYEELPCEDCHLTTAGASEPDVDNWDPNDGTISQISEEEWTTSGHGTPSTDTLPWPPDSNGPELSCLTNDTDNDIVPTGGCHTDRVTHDRADNPFRLVGYDTVATAFDSPLDADSMDDFCYNCHDSLAVRRHSQDITSPGDAAAWGPPAPPPQRYRCVDCHDMHGDSPDYMIQAQVFAGSSNDLGEPVEADIRPTGASVILFDIDQTAPFDDPQLAYVDLTSASDVKICQVCHTINNYFQNTSGSVDPPPPHNGNTGCTVCHPHSDGFKPLCEICHSTQTAFPEAPNVMGDGTQVNGTLIFDDGTYGYNVNGHGIGQVNTGADTRQPKCEDCHSLGATHFDGTVNTHNWPGKASDTTNTNTSHLNANFFPGGSPASSDYQLAFDDYCWLKCHADGGGSATSYTKFTLLGSALDDMRHVINTIPAANVVQFGDFPSAPGTAGTNPDPKSATGGIVWGDGPYQGPGYSDAEKLTPVVGPGWDQYDQTSDEYWTPWVIFDLTTDATANPGLEQPHYGVCVSCHDPHGTRATDRMPTRNLMMRYNSDPPPPAEQRFWCNSQCHGR